MLDPDPIDPKTYLAAELLKTIAHPMRMRIVFYLSHQDSLNVGALQNLLQIEQSLLSHHLIKMHDRGILQHTRQGKEMYYSVADPNFTKVVKLLLTNVVIF